MISLSSLFQNKEDVLINEQIREIYNKIDHEIPTNYQDLEKKHKFEFFPICENAGAFGHFYELKNNLGGKVLYGRKKNGYHGLIPQVFAFERLRKEYINHRVGLELGIKLPKKINFVLAKEIKNNYNIPMIISENLGKIEVGNVNMKLSEIVLSKNKFESEIKKLIPYLLNGGMIDFNDLGHNMNYYQKRDNRMRGADICYVNSRWKNDEAYLIDTGKWKFKELKY